eukprot:286597-Amorphochlora_amoeboformis.AAC.1
MQIYESPGRNHETTPRSDTTRGLASSLLVTTLDHSREWEVMREILTREATTITQFAEFEAKAHN